MHFALTKDIKIKAVKIAAALLVLVLSLTVFAPWLSSPDVFSGTIEELDEAKKNVLKLFTSSASASTVITMIPDDCGTPIANELADLSGCFMVILCLVYVEKYLLTTLSYVLFTFVLPITCIFFIICEMKPKLKGFYNIFKKTTILLLSLLLLIPISTTISDKIQKTYSSSINDVINSAVASGNHESQEEETEDKGWFQNIIDGVTNSVSSAIDWAKSVLNKFVEATAIMLVTSCIIPILVYIIGIYLVKKLLNFDLPKFGHLTSHSKKMLFHHSKQNLPKLNQ